MAFRDDFEDDRLDRSVWFPHYLPAWSSQERTRASYRLDGSCLQLYVPSDTGLWCAEEHPDPLRVSGIQSGNRSGPAGTTAGQQRFKDHLAVREEQPRFEGWLPSSGRVAIRCRMRLSARSMAAMWLSGFEDDPADAGELCVVEIFGRSVDQGSVDQGSVDQCGSAEVGVGVKKLYDPRLVQDFVAPRLPIDITAFHTYAVEWDAGEAMFLVDGAEVHRSRQGTAYPMQVMLAVFDFPAWSSGDDDHLVPELHVDWIAGDT
jgi:hypothetical protein